jgi:hypothetical protein
MGMPVETQSSPADPQWIGENTVPDIFGGQEVKTSIIEANGNNI